MKQIHSSWRCIVMLAALLLCLPATDLCAGTIYIQTNLVSDVSGLAKVTEANLKNPWGMSFSSKSPFSVSDQAKGRATL